MSRLKELTWEHHKNAERQKFVKVLMGGKISPEVYATFLYNQHPLTHYYMSIQISKRTILPLKSLNSIHHGRNITLLN